MGSSTEIDKFYVKNCALAAIATNERASSLMELRDKIAMIDEGSIYFHFWGGRMNPQFVHSQHHNDFASWAFHRLHDNILAEQLGIIDPTEFSSLEALRQELLETIENRLDEYEIVLWTKKEDQFHFIRSSVIIFETSIIISKPEELSQAIALLPPSSIFYHFIDARVRTEEKLDDFSVWLKRFGNQYEELMELIQAVDPYFLSLVQLREELSAVIKKYFEDREGHS